MANKFKVGDAVTTTNAAGRTYGYTGVVSASHPWGDVVVKYPHLSAPAYFFHANLKHADTAPTKPKGFKSVDKFFDDYYVVVYYACDHPGDYPRITEGNIQSNDTFNAIFEELQDIYDEALFFKNKEEFEEWTVEISTEYELIFGLVNNKPFRFISRPTLEFAEEA